MLRTSEGSASGFDECFTLRRPREAFVTFRPESRRGCPFAAEYYSYVRRPNKPHPPRSHRTIVYSTFRIFQRNHAFEGYGRGRRIPGARMEGPKVYSSITGWDLLGTQDPGTRSTPTPLPGRLHLALVGREDGSLHPNSFKSI